MAARGGFKPTTSLRPEQLQGMGITGKDMPSSTVSPPPTFPPLQSRPALLERSVERDFMIEWKNHFLDYLKHSSYFTNPNDTGPVFHHQRFYRDNSIERRLQSFAWDYMPAELRPNWKRKTNAKEEQSAKIAKVVNIEETLKALEQREVNSRRRKREDVKEQSKDSDNENENENEEVEDEEQDDEMDEDNDYGFSYFDNGDDYNEEDDNLDDGPVY